MNDWNEFKKEYYGKKLRVNCGSGFVDFDPDSMEKVDTKGQGFKSYDEYLDIQIASCKKSRRYFELAYYAGDGMTYFKGRIERFDKTRGKVVFQRIMVDGMYTDGIGFDGKEDHVWMDIGPFASYTAGDCIHFEAEIHRYLKTRNGKQIDYDLRNPRHVKLIPEYEVPTDEELIDQQIDQLVCETCRYYDHCYMCNCIANEEERKERFELLKSFQPGKFTSFTVMLAYELEYRVLMQAGGIRLDKKDPNYHVMKKFAEICNRTPVYYTGNPKEALFRMTNPDKPRLYIE